MARKVNNQTYREWRDEYLNKQQMTLPMDLDAKRQLLYAACPNGFLPSSDGLRWQHFVKMDADTDRREGLVQLVDKTTGTLVAEDYSQLSFDEFRETCVRRAKYAAVDLDKIREMALHWADKNQPGLNLDTFMDEVKQAAGI